MRLPHHTDGGVIRKMWDRGKADVTGLRLGKSDRTALNPDVGQASPTRGRKNARPKRGFTSTNR